MKISVVICSHNPREDFLGRTLAALKAQTLAPTDWELLLVDNASEKPLAGRFNLDWHPHARHVREEKLGLTHARLRGIAESIGDLLVFVDDDNVLRADYLDVSLKIGAQWPVLGAWGGSYIPEYEVEPPEELRPWLITALVIDKVSDPVWAKLPYGNFAHPPGAGVVVRRKQASHYRELVLQDPMRQALGRTGKMLGGCEDGDMALSGFKIGYGTGRFPELELTHLIPAGRLTLEYLKGVHRGFGYSGTILSAIYEKENPFPGQIRSGALRVFLLKIVMLVTGKSRIEREIRMARENGRLQAERDLARSGH